MSRLTFVVMAAVAASSSLAQVLYTPVRSIKDQNISLKSWGSGSMAETDEAAYEGTTSLRVSTRNYFQGGMMRLGQPVDVAGAFTDKNNMLRFVIRVQDMGMTFGGGGALGGTGGGEPGGKTAGAPPGLGAGNSGGSGGPPGQGRGGGSVGPPGGQGRGGGSVGPPSGGGGALGGGSQVTESLKNLRVIITTTDGKRSEVYLPLETSSASERNWRLVAIPLQAINGLSDSNKAIESVSFSGDATSTFYVGEVRVINDSTPITGDTTFHDLNLALGDEIDFVGMGYGGASVLKYQWDFDQKDGMQVDAEGQSVRRKFRKPGKFVVTLTIVDVFGLKKPHRTTVNVTVNP